MKNKKQKEFRATKRFLKAKAAEDKIDSKTRVEIKLNNNKLDLEKFSIVSTGVQNNYSELHTEYLKNKQKLAELKSFNKKGSNSVLIAAQKEKIAGIKKQLDIEEKIFKEEYKQIAELNKFSKGKPSLDNKEEDIITIRNVNKYYASKRLIFQALKNADLSIKKGSFNVILGPSGSGKTTLLNMISGLDRPTYGSIVVNNVDISALTTPQLTQFRRKNIGFVFQSYNLLPSLNVRDNIEVGRSLQMMKSKRLKINDILDDIDMQGSNKKKIYELSGGQQQRVSIARAIAKAPNILIGDEPTGALDRETSLKVIKLFQELNRTKRTTVILVTHNPKIAAFANQVITVRDGFIDEVKTNSKPKDARKVKGL